MTPVCGCVEENECFPQGITFPTFSAFEGTTPTLGTGSVSDGWAISDLIFPACISDGNRNLSFSLEFDFSGGNFLYFSFTSQTGGDRGVGITVTGAPGARFVEWYTNGGLSSNAVGTGVFAVDALSFQLTKNRLTGELSILVNESVTESVTIFTRPTSCASLNINTDGSVDNFIVNVLEEWCSAEETGIIRDLAIETCGRQPCD